MTDAPDNSALGDSARSRAARWLLVMRKADLFMRQPWTITGPKDTGYLRAGDIADTVVFDPERYAPMAGYADPRELSRGLDHLLVNGRPAIADGKLTGIAAGRARLHTPTPGACP